MSQAPLGQTPVSTSTPALPDNRSIVPQPTPADHFDLNNIQGDIYPNFPKKAEHFVFFEIKDPAAFKTHLEHFIPYITTAAKVIDNLGEVQKARVKNKGHPKPLPKERLVRLEQYQIAFSHAAFKILGITGDLDDPDFAAGQLAQAEELGDHPTLDSTPSAFDVDWDPVWKHHPAHGVILAATESYETSHEAVHTVRKVFGTSIHIINVIQGHVRPGSEEGHEHFGFLDGVSLPAIRGLVTPHTGQLECDPGVIIMGHTGDSKAQSRPDWAKDGSLMAFRKLRQYVPEFNRFLLENPILDEGLSPEEGSALRGAKMVGRWKSGAPIDLAPLRDNVQLTKSVDTINHFNYQLPTKGEDRCPFAAHIRKTAPRVNAQIPEKFLESALIMRAGIPYGPEVTPDEQSAMATDKDRGLAFVCYQSSLNPGFKFLQTIWANPPSFPPDETTGAVQNPLPGTDPIIGNAIGAQRPREVSGTDPGNLSAELTMPKDFVVARGGEYFWVPSLKALGMLSRNEVLGPAPAPAPAPTPTPAPGPTPATA